MRSLGFTGREHSDETRRKMSEAKRGALNWMWGRRGPANPNWGRKHTPKWKRDMSRRMTGPRHPMYGKTHSAETKAKMVDRMTRPRGRAGLGKSGRRV